MLRAASAVHRHLVGRLSFGVDEGVCGWVARTGEPALIRENALADPRMKYVAELEEERFQSMVAVPIARRSGAVAGVVVLHTVAPREFDDAVVNFLVNAASLVAGAIENAELLPRHPPPGGRAHHALAARPGAGGRDAPRGAPRRRDARRARADPRRHLPAVPPRARERRARAGGGEPARGGGAAAGRGDRPAVRRARARSGHRHRGGGRPADRAGGRRRRAPRRPVLPHERAAALRPRGRRAAALRRPPGRGGARAGRADRGADRREPRPRDVPGAGRGRPRRRDGAGGAGGARPRAAARDPAGRARPWRARDRAGAVGGDRGPGPGPSAGGLPRRRLPRSATSACAGSSRCTARRTGWGTCASRARSSPPPRAS